METGIVKCWITERGFGFVTDENGDDVFCHRRALPSGMSALEPGVKVLFEAETTDKGDAATVIQLLGEEVASGPVVLTEAEFRREFRTAPRNYLPVILRIARLRGWVK